tara:strand:+ start:258 stop:797 length:540 start_codon:yes stop_codon:yes gene_type:complete
MKFSYWYVNNFLNKSEINTLNSYILKKGKPFLAQASTIKTAVCKCVPYVDLKVISKLSPTIYTINKKAFGFDIYSHYDNLFVLNTYDSKTKSEYKFHVDSEPPNENYTIKLTSLINLSQQKYEGGELILHPTTHPITIKEFETPGALVVFPSFILHKVNPVTKGIRKSGLLFTTGHWWR